MSATTTPPSSPVQPGEAPQESETHSAGGAAATATTVVNPLMDGDEAAVKAASRPSPPPAAASASSAAATPEGHSTIRFEDLGEPVQRLLRSLQGGMTDDDMALLEYVSVKDMAKIYTEMQTDRHAEEIWRELRDALEARAEKMALREGELTSREAMLAVEQRNEAERLQQQMEEEEQERIAAEEARARRREERRRRRAEKAAAAAEEAEAAEQAAAAAAEEAAEEAAAAAEEAERQRKAERKRKRREARARELQEEEEALAAERAKHEAKKKLKAANQRKEWDDYVQSHPLEYAQGTGDSAGQLPAVIEQQQVKHTLNAPPIASEKLMARTYTPSCQSCGSRFDRPPVQWNCPVCYKRTSKMMKVWQPDTDTNTCMMCKEPIGWWSRHHCRNCGRLVCANCSEKRAIIRDLGYDTPVRVCYDCVRLRTK